MPVTQLRSLLPPRWRRRIRVALRWPRPRWGNLRRREPFSADYGLERGTPVDRIYIESFLHGRAHDVRGRVLEVKNAAYTRQIGGARVQQSDVVDIDPANPQATVVADLGEPSSLPEDSFDCIILTQTLQLVPDFTAALRNCWQALRPGGTLLLTVPCVSIVVERINDLWRWTPPGFAIEVGRALPEAEVAVEGHGTLPATLAFLHGLAAEELRPSDLLPADPRYPLLVTARIARPAPADGDRPPPTAG